LLVISRPLFAVVFHDYLAAIVTIVWLVVFWWFAYKFVLVEKTGKVKVEKEPRQLKEVKRNV
jgi:hypothetical protein